MKTKLGKNIDTVINGAVRDLVKRKYLKEGGRVVVVFGAKDATGGTDRMKIMTIGNEE